MLFGWPNLVTWKLINCPKCKGKGCQECNDSGFMWSVPREEYKPGLVDKARKHAQ